MQGSTDLGTTRTLSSIGPRCIYHQARKFLAEAEDFVGQTEEVQLWGKIEQSIDVVGANAKTC